MIGDPSPSPVRCAQVPGYEPPNKVKRKKEKRPNSRPWRRPLRRLPNYPLIHVCRPGAALSAVSQTIHSSTCAALAPSSSAMVRPTPDSSRNKRKRRSHLGFSAFPRFMSGVPQALVWAVKQNVGSGHPRTLLAKPAFVVYNSFPDPFQVLADRQRPVQIWAAVRASRAKVGWRTSSQYMITYIVSQLLVYP